MTTELQAIGTSYSNTLTRFSAAETADTPLVQLNNLEGEIEDLFNQLAAQVGGITNKSSIVVHQVALSPDTYVGALVYFDATDALFKPALAGLLGEPGTQGQTLETPASRVVGMVIDIYDTAAATNNITGTLLLGGMWNSRAAVEGCIGDAAAPGTYYLSPSRAGGATLNPDYHLRQPVFTYFGQYSFGLNIFYMAHDNHWHGSLRLDSSLWYMWLDGDPNPNKPAEPPATGTWYWYDLAEDANAVGLGDLAQRTTAIFSSGILAPADDIDLAGFYIQDGVLWFKGDAAPVDVTLFNHFPFAYGSPVLRDITSSNDALVVTKRNGLVTLTQNAFVGGSVARTGTAISNINGRTLEYTPVISGIAAGPGTSVSISSRGVATISATSVIGYPMDAYNVNANGATVTSDGTLTYFMFPSGRQNAGFVIGMPVTGIDSSTRLSAVVWGWCVNATASFDVSISVVPDPQINSSSTNVQQNAATGTLSFGAGGITYAESTCSVQLTGGGMLFARITASGAPATDIRLLRMGFKLTLLSSAEATPIPEREPTTEVSRVVYNGTAGEAIAMYQCVRVAANGKLYVCASSNASDMTGYVGIALDTVTAGDTCSYITQGMLTGLSGISAGAAVFVGVDGGLSQVDPQTISAATFVKQVGVALSATTLLVQPATGILK